MKAGEVVMISKYVQHDRWWWEPVCWLLGHNTYELFGRPTGIPPRWGWRCRRCDWQRIWIGKL